MNDYRPYLGMPCLSIRQPWAWLILHAGKDVENRSRNTNFRGRVLIHAAQGCTQKEYLAAYKFFMDVKYGLRPYAHREPPPGRYEGIHFPALKDLERGGIVGEMRIVGCDCAHPSRWYEFGNWAWEISEAKPLPFVPCKGALGIFRLQPKHFEAAIPFGATADAVQQAVKGGAHAR